MTLLPWTMPHRRTLTRAALLHRLSPSHLATMVMTVIGAGTALAIFTTTDPLWWQLHFSKLGTFDDFSGHMFNGTLIAAGGLIFLFAIRVHADLAGRHRLPRRRARLFVALVASVGAHLAIVGLIPVNVNEFWHDRAASGLMLSFLGILIGTGVTWRIVPRRLRRATAIVGIGLAISIAGFIAGVVNLAALELVAFSLIFWWIGVFTKCLRRSAVSLPDAGIASAAAAEAAPKAVPQDRHARRPRSIVRRPMPVRASRPRPLVRAHARPGARPAVRAIRPRGYTAWGGRSASAPSRTRDRR